LAAGLVMALVVNGAVVVSADAALAAPTWSPPPLPAQKTTPVKAVTGRYATPAVAPKLHSRPGSWPSGSADVSLAAASTRAAKMPLWFGRTAKKTVQNTGDAQVSFAGRPATAAAGVDGVLLSIKPTAAGSTHVKLSYSSFRDAYGGDWAARLRLVSMPSCALTTPQVAACRVQTPVRSTNDTGAETLEADLALPGAASGAVVLAATADSSSGNGDFSATSLQPSGAWSSGGNGDAFVWSYPIDVPDVPGGLTPKVALTYDSQSQDGLTSSTNNQSSWIGDGWGYSPGFIERGYRSCHENPAGVTKTWDNCWTSKNTLTMSLGGVSTTLVKDDATGVYHGQQDANEKVEHLTGAVNGAQDGEYWRVTTGDGTQYYFGKNELPGWTGSSTPATNSVLTEPVFATASGQPCYNATFSKSFCQQAYRWNLDYVVDTHEDVVSYFYSAPQTNFYASDLGTTANVPYIRDSYLTKIQYGQRDGEVYSSTPAGEVDFSTNGRCDTASSGCATSTLTSTTAKDWPDVPFDATCADGAACKGQSPAFWSNVMLTGIQTKALSGTTLLPVDSWTLAHSFPATGDGTTQSLWLDSVTRTGQDASGTGPTAPITVNPVTFTGTAMANRVKVTNGYPPLTRHRLTKITTETGETISIGYSTAVCATCAPSDPSTNTTLAYPSYWTPPGQSDPMLDWFNKYVVTAVAEQDSSDLTAKDVVTTYTPVGNPAWHYDTDPLTPDNRRTWNQWRGFAGMTTSTGNAPDPVTKTTSTYFRGMNGDHLPSGARAVSLTDSRGDTAVPDNDEYAGATYETQVFNGSNLVSDTITDPWASGATATQSALGYKAFHAGSASTRVYTPLASGSTRETETDYTHDSYGRVTATNDRGDVATTADDLCTTTAYADNTTTGWILDAPSETRTVKVACTSTPSVPADVVSDELTYYDGSTTLGAAPTVGDATSAKKVQSYTGNTPNYATTSTTSDQYGRPLSVTDADNHITTTVYTPATGAQPTKVTTTDPLKFTSTTTYDPLRGLPLKATTPAGYATTGQYDALGRLTAVYQPGQSTGAGDPPTVKHTYTISNSGPSIVTTCDLNNNASGCTLSETLYDAMLRPRETQSQTPGAGRVQTDTFYNSDGWKSAVTAPYYSGNAVGTEIQPAQDGDIPSETGYTYDGAGRKTADISYHLADETWRTTYTYGGNFVTTVPPTGATATTSVTDARGNNVDLRQYHAGVTADYLHATAGSYDDTVYTYTPSGKRATEVDNAGNSWSWGYDLLGDQTDAKDPDTGEAVTAYDPSGLVTKVTNAEQHQITTTYDADNRRTAEYDTSSTQTLSATNELAAWKYDSVKKGLLTSSTSYSDGDTFTDAITLYGLYGTPVTRKLTLTGTDAGLLPTGGYTYSYGYDLNGLPSGQTDPAIADLPNENLRFGYDSIDQPTTLTSTGGVSNSYVSATGYSNIGQPLQYTLSANGSAGSETMTYDEQTQALTGIAVAGFGHGGNIDDITYTYGNSSVSKGAGLLTKAVDKRDAATTTDTQCFGYDYAQRLQQAWTATDDCTAGPSSSTAGGPVAPYWQSWTYDKAGNRASQTDHGVGGAGDTTTTYNYPAAGSPTDQPHTLTNTTATGPGSTTQTGSYVYDKTGNTTSITGGAHGNEALTWAPAGQLNSDTTTGGTTSYAYDADGNQLVQRDPVSTTLFLGDEQIVINNTTKTLTGTRYYSYNGTVLAVRNGGAAPSYLIADRQGTGEIAIDTDNANTVKPVTRRQYTPFGETRGATPTMNIGNIGYVGGTNDTNTGFETLGARQYDPTLGRFLSADPILDAGNPEQLNGYDYANNDPITLSDPAGTDPCWAGGDGCDTQGASGTYYPNETEADKAGDGQCTNDATCSLVQSGGGNTGHKHKHRVKPLPVNKTMNDPALGSKEVPLQFLKNNNYHGSDEFTYADALKWAKTSSLASTYVCEHVFNAGDKACGDNHPTMSNKEALILVLLFFLGAGFGGGEDDAVGDGNPADDEPISLDNPAEGTTSLKEDEDLGSCLTRNSFAPDTLVLMADGTTKPIRDVKVGDELKTTDPVTGVTRDEVVTQLHDNLDTDMADVVVSTGDNRAAVIHTTENHRFWDTSTFRWTVTADLRPGEQLASTDGNARVLAVHTATNARHMLNLTVAVTHTYYVLAGNTPVLVHNEGGVPVPPFVDGQDFEWSIQTPKGNVGMLAETSVSGGRVTLSNVVVYGDSPELTRGSLGTSTVLKALRGQIAPAAAAQGFDELTISGIRLTGPVGHRPDFTLDLKKYAGGGGC
jgi:RHS repeat-associated protein